MQNVGSAFKRVRNLIRFFPMCLLFLCCIFFGSVDVKKKRVVVRCVLVTGYLCKNVWLYVSAVLFVHGVNIENMCESKVMW